MAEQVPAVGNILSLIERRDWDRLQAALAPDIRWTTAVEEDLRGPEAVIERLRRDPVPGPPAFHELRDGLLVRWIDKVG
ncbi:MAG: nuclear transport factor 2 family protein [Aeromicrobium sp.]|uniref:hypothetical protein n=1 Tax=Aeromicrobium sp. TaxID=1871063 RepID=UPI0039E6F09D